MLSTKGRVVTNAIFGPVARTLVRAGVSPDTVTVTGTVLTVAVALWLLPTGHFVAGPLAIAVVVLIDSVDGLMARMLGRSTRWGAFLDSTLDRLADAAIFSGILLWGISADEPWVLGTALACLVLGSVVPYAKARAEGLGMTASGGIAERADRLFVALAAVLAVGLGAPLPVLVVALGLLALASLYTVGQRMGTVYRQTRGDTGQSA
ncbi:phosphatidylinositol phosphate synthase [Georgenia sp. 1P01AC]|uniref:phosphatidylinositol phosphate synthase n=1 Tax=unclassified Georgenia TaxID=2626815 RepID=UPI0039AFAA31